MKKTMKINILAIIFFVFGSAISATAQSNLTITPAKPRPGEVVKFSYTPSAKVFAPNEPVQLTMFKMGEYADPQTIAQAIYCKEKDVELKKVGNTYQGSFVTDAQTLALAFNFTSANPVFKKVAYNVEMQQGKFDSNDSLGYVIPMYDESGEELPGANYYCGTYYAFLSNTYSLTNKQLARSYFLKELEKNPDGGLLAILYLPQVCGSEEASELKSIQEKQLDYTLSKDSLTYYDYRKINALAGGLEQKGLTKFFYLLNEKNPGKNCEPACTKLYEQLDKEKNIEKKYALLVELEKRFNLMPFYEKVYSYVFPFNSYKARIAFMQYVLSQSKGNLTQFDQYAAKLNYNKESTLYEPMSIMSELNVIIDSLGKLDMAEKKAFEYLNYNKQQVAKIKNGEPTPKNLMDEYFSKGHKLAQLEAAQRGINRTLSTIYAQKGDTAQAYAYFKTMLDAMDKRVIGPDLKERYAILAENIVPTKELMTKLEEMVTSQVYTPKITEVLKRLYVKDNGSANGFDAYLSKMQKAENAEMMKELATTMVNIPAPEFTLTDMDGKTVSLSDYKGKTVIIDFWATWCGPCKASMPAMQKLQEKLDKNNGNVKIFFLDVMEKAYKTEPEKIAAVKSFIAKNKYPFHVLFDTPVGKTAIDYEVSGIPTKIIIDKNGNIRFRLTGYNSNEEQMIAEMIAALEMVK